METSGTELTGFALTGPVLATMLEPFIQKVPGDWKRLVPILIGLGFGILKAISSGQPWFTGLLTGGAMAGTAIYHHDANMMPAATP